MVFGRVYPGQVHASDMSAPASDGKVTPLDEGVDLFSRALESWIPCFQAQARTSEPAKGGAGGRRSGGGDVLVMVTMLLMAILVN